MSSVVGWVVFALIVLAILIALWARFYKRATRNVSLIRTGIGGRKIIMDGGTLAIPFFHEVSRVNMQTLRLEVRREGESAVITKDRLRMDIGIEFYVSVIATKEGVARAAQTLGNRTFNPQELNDLIEGKLLAAVRSAAAQATMDEMHENRSEFVNQVRDSLVESLERNGLEIDSVSLTALDQTPFGALDENNVFNAVGMRRLAEVIAKNRKERAEIDGDAEVSVHRAAMEATRQKLLIDLEQEEAEISQVQKIESMKAAQIAEVAKRKANSEREAAHARILMEQDIREADIARERAVREAEISRDRELRKAEIDHETFVEMANQDRQITLAKKTQETSKARAQADAVMAEAVKASEQINTVKRLSEADRRKQLALLEAQQQAEVSALRARNVAEVEKDTAAIKATTTVQQAKGEAEASEIRSTAKKTDMIAEAEGRRAMVEVENAMSDRVVALKLSRERLEALPRILAEMVKPAEKIESIKIHQITGLGGLGGHGASTGDQGEKPVVNQAIDSILDMAVQLPALKRIGEELGLSVGGGFTDFADQALKGGEKDKESEDH